MENASVAVVVGSIYLVSTIAFGLMAGVIGLRLIAMSLRTGQQAERWLGAGLLLTAGLGYMPMIVAMVAKQAHPGAAGLLDAITICAWVVHNLGVVCMLAFIVQVFRASSRWAWALSGAMAAVLWVGWGLYLQQGGVGGQPTSGYWIAFATIGTYPLWNAFESFRYHRLMRRRLALGLADPVVVDRFRLWGVASLCAVASIWVVNLPFFLGKWVGTGAATPITSLCMVITAAFGIATVGGYWLTFFPPAWYRARLARTASAG
jgi:hypothetical protein